MLLALVKAAKFPIILFGVCLDLYSVRNIGGDIASSHENFVLLQLKLDSPGIEHALFLAFISLINLAPDQLYFLNRNLRLYPPRQRTCKKICHLLLDSLIDLFSHQLLL